MANVKFMQVVWPAFLAACVLELVVFAMVDPHDLHWMTHPVPMSRQAVYTVGFFVFWAISAAACALTLLLAKPAADVNICPFVPAKRPPDCPRP